MRVLFTELSCDVAKSEFSAEATAGERAATPVREPLDSAKFTSEATVVELVAVVLFVAPELKSARIVSSRETSEVALLVLVDVGVGLVVGVGVGVVVSVRVVVGVVLPAVDVEDVAVGEDVVVDVGAGVGVGARTGDI
jgi:hypothetical protein